MTDWDRVLIDAVGALVAAPVSDDDRIGLEVGLIAEALQAGAGGDGRVRALAAAGRDIVDTFQARRSRGGGVAWARARFDAGRALADLLCWRVGLLRDRAIAAAGGANA